jgi:hypothetical protein
MRAAYAAFVVTCVISGTPGTANYQCVINNANVTNSRDPVLIGRIHPSGGTDAHIRIVEFRNSQLSHIPNQLFEAFPGIVTLNAGSTNLRFVGVLQNCRNLQFLNINNNRLIELPTRWLSACTRLASINVQNNQITDLEPWLLRAFPNLQIFNIQQNRMTIIRNRALLTATTRTALDFRFGQNPIERIEGGFNKSAIFTNLLFNDCRIDEIDRNFLSNVTGRIDNLAMHRNRCIDMSIPRVNAATLPGITPFFQRCFVNFDRTRTTRPPPPPTEPATTPRMD